MSIPADDAVSWVERIISGEENFAPRPADLGLMTLPKDHPIHGTIELFGRMARQSVQVEDDYLMYMVLMSIIYSMYTAAEFSFKQIAATLTTILVDHGGFHRSSRCFDALGGLDEDKD